MVTLGYHCSHEQLPPSQLLAHAALAADAGFTAGMCSDHFRPWSERQGHSGYTWSWLGAALATTPLSFGTVCAPGQRYHPAVIAQAAATLAEMYPSRFWLALGSGEALNEAITGEPWPPKAVRQRRLEACADIMRRLWRGETVTMREPVAVKEARLFSRPVVAPLIVGAALSVETARWMGGWADALVTIATTRDTMRRIVDAFREGGGGDKPLFLQVAVAYAPTDDEAAAAAYDQWRHCVLPSPLLADLELPSDFDRASAHASVADVVARVRCSNDAGRHLAWLEEDAAMGFERIFLHNLVRERQREFLEMCGTHLLPAWRTREARPASR
jgi:probable non-F420 flavinoid oxidoreductase